MSLALAHRGKEKRQEISLALVLPYPKRPLATVVVAKGGCVPSANVRFTRINECRICQAQHRVRRPWLAFLPTLLLDALGVIESLNRTPRYGAKVPLPSPFPPFEAAEVSPKRGRFSGVFV